MSWRISSNISKCIFTSLQLHFKNTFSGIKLTRKRTTTVSLWCISINLLWTSSAFLRNKHIKQLQRAWNILLPLEGNRHSKKVKLAFICTTWYHLSKMMFVSKYILCMYYSSIYIMAISLSIEDCGLKVKLYTPICAFDWFVLETR